LLCEGDAAEAHDRLEEWLEGFRRLDDGGREWNLGEPILWLLLHANCPRICRRELFCPMEGCQKRILHIPGLLGHLRKDHGETEEDTKDLVQYFIAKMLPRKLRVALFKMNGTRVEVKWDTERCHSPKCKYVHGKHDRVESHHRSHAGLQQNIEALGWFWGTIRTIVEEKKKATIAEVLGEGEIYRCTVPRCGEIFSSEKAIRAHFSRKHGELLQAEWVAPRTRLQQRFELEIPGEERRGNLEGANAAEEDEEAGPRVRRRAGRGVNVAGRGAEGAPPRIEADMVVQREAAAVIMDPEARKAEFLRKREEYERKTDQGVNIPRLDAQQMRRVKRGLSDLFEYQINPLIEEFQPSADDWDDWTAFEGAYEESMHEIRMHIMGALNRDPRRLYGARRMNARLQETREQTAETIVNHQQMRNTLRKLKSILEEIAEGNEDEAGTRRRRMKLTRRIGAVANLVSAERMREVFNTESHEAIWEAMNTSEDHRGRVIEWLESLMMTEVEAEVEGMTERMQAQRVQEAYRTSKSIAMRRYVDKVQSPPCPIEVEGVRAHFGETWSAPRVEFQEAGPDSIFHLEPRLPAEASAEMEEYMTNEKHIAEVINSRQDLSASGVDGISYQIIKAAGKEGVRFVKNLITASIRCGRVMTKWKEARTILLYKKGDRNVITNWRPISITNCIYRIFTCLMARSFQEMNRKYQVYTDSQKGFIKKTNGCSEHGIMLNELIHDARRKGKDLVVTAIDFTNAFGSVPHEMIISTMRQRNFPGWIVEIVRDMYVGATSVIELKGNRTERIGWKRGVKQGCPLSPLLFNLCIEPLLKGIATANRRTGAFVEVGDERIEFATQAYADDVVFVSQRPEGISEMLRTLEDFERWSRMEVNVAKCATASYLIDTQGHRCTLSENLRLGGQEIPNLTMAQSLKYLGTAVSARRTVKLSAAQQKISDMKIRIQKIVDSPLKTVQKIDAIKTFVLPTLDSTMLNGDVGKRQLEHLDQKIRAEVDRMLKVRGLPVECHYASWRDGGLSYPSLVDRRDVLIIRSFGQMMLSKDQKIRTAMTQLAEDERRMRRIEEDAEGRFLRWQNGRGGPGTASLIARARTTCKELGIRLKMEDDTMIVTKEALEFKTKTAVGIGRFLTQKIVRPSKLTKLMTHAVHGASYGTLKASEVSNGILTNVYTKKSDAFFRYVVVARADCLATPANIARWFPGRAATPCRHCGNEATPTQAHILNSCTRYFPLMTTRHNNLAGVVRRAIEEMIAVDLDSEIRENTSVPVENLTFESRNLRPDIVFRRRENQHQVWEIIEFSCPYGYTNQDGNTLERVFERKTQKYARLAQEIMDTTHIRARVSAIIVSSLGAVHLPSLKQLHGILKCDDGKLRKLGRRMSETVISGSIEIWRQFTREMERHQGNAEAERLIEAEIEGQAREDEAERRRNAGAEEAEPALQQIEGEVEGLENRIEIEIEDEDEDDDDGLEGADEEFAREHRYRNEADVIDEVIAVSELERNGNEDQ
jgi:uncharacterized C2H2 Zn-finger protein